MYQNSIRILLADDHDVVRRGLRSLLEAREWNVCGEARNGLEAIDMALELRPDLVIVDLEMPGLNGLGVTRQIKKHHPDTDVVIFTMHDTDYLVEEALTAGARAFVLKSDGGNQLIKTIESLSVEKLGHFPRGSDLMPHEPTKNRAPRSGGQLTSREIQIVRSLAEGKSNKDIAHELDISVKTVETHRSAIMRKLKINSLAQLVRYAIRNNLANA